MGRVVHFEIHAGALDRPEKFYTEVFGWQVQRWDGPVDYRLLTTGTDAPGIDGAIVGRHGEIDGVSVNAFVCTSSVDDLGAIERSVPEAGGQLALARTDVPGVGQLAYFKDTEGNIFGALEPVSPG